MLKGLIVKNAGVHVVGWFWGCGSAGNRNGAGGWWTKRALWPDSTLHT